MFIRQLQRSTMSRHLPPLLHKLFIVGSLLSIPVLLILNRPLDYAPIYIGVILVGVLVALLHIRDSYQIFARRSLPRFCLLMLFAIACLGLSLFIHGVNTTFYIYPLNQTYQGFPFSWLSHYIDTPQYIPRATLPAYMNRHVSQIQSELHPRSIVIDTFFYLHIGIILFAAYHWLRRLFSNRSEGAGR